jgi:hypothetical protein
MLFSTHQLPRVCPLAVDRRVCGRYIGNLPTSTEKSFAIVMSGFAQEYALDEYEGEGQNREDNG